MRPRVFPAEDGMGGAVRDHVGDASMRPRVFPAEDVTNRTSIRCPGRASMRPRVFPAEDSRCVGSQATRTQASMRPRVFPAEDVGNARIRRLRRDRFNEAAGIPRGRRADASKNNCMLSASMRPRVFPAEDSSPTMGALRRCRRRFNEAAGIPRGRPGDRSSAPLSTARGFNEAAGIPRGRRVATPTASSRGTSFNEAAGIPRGRLPRHPAFDPGRRASMRPRVFPAEDNGDERRVLDRGGASMRPRVFPAEDMGSLTPRSSPRCFNEAAGIPRGRLTASAVAVTPAPVLQ